MGCGVVRFRPWGFDHLGLYGLRVWGEVELGFRKLGLK